MTVLEALYRGMSTAALERLRRDFERDRRPGAADRAFVDRRLRAIAAELRRRRKARRP